MKKIIYLVFLALLVLIVAGGTLYYVSSKSVTQTLSVGSTTQDCLFSDTDLLNMMNSVRDNKLVIDGYLDSVSQKRADTMPYELDLHAGFRVLMTDGTLYNKGFSALGENLASNHCASTKQLFTQWRNSPPHWATIEDERYDAVGIGFNGQSAVVIFADLN